MVRTKLILTIIATVMSLGGTGLWFLVSERQEAQAQRETFLGSTREYPTSGGEKMKLEW